MIKECKYIFVLMVMVLVWAPGRAQTVIALYPHGVPNAIDGPDEERADTTGIRRIAIRNVSQPTLTAFFPDKANGTAVIICPGGGYSYLEISHVGYDIAKEFIKFGVTAFVLKYRLPGDKIMKDKSIGPLQDAQQAIKLVRERAAEWRLDTNKIGIAGFSAGGHLASSLGTHYTNAVIENKEHTSLRPDFMILGWPVISMADSLMHKGSRDRLLGNAPSGQSVVNYSNELQVTIQTPPAFLVHAGDDKTVKVANSILFYQALLKNGVAAELHIYAKGGHGFGLNNPTTPDKWLDHCKNWMIANGWVDKSN